MFLSIVVCMSVFRLATLNVRGLRTQKKQSMLKAVIQKLDVHVLCLQETHFFCLADVKNFERTTGLLTVNSFGAWNARGVSVAFSPAFRGEVKQYVRDDQGRVIVVDVGYRGKVYKIANVYAPVDNQERNTFFDTLDPYMLGSGERILIGDFNCVLNQCIDSQGGSLVSRPWKAKALRRLVNAYRFVDVWEQLYRFTPGFTFHAQGRSVRLDRCYVDADVANSLVDSEVIQLNTDTVFFSDHCMFVAEFVFGNGVGRQPNRWRLNTTLLNDEEVVTDITSILRAEKSEGVHSSDWWEGVKYRIVRAFQKWGRKRAQERREAIYAVRWGLRNLRGLGLATAAQQEAYRELQEDLSVLLLKSSQPLPTPNYGGQVAPMPRELNTAKIRTRPVSMQEVQGPDGILRQTQEGIEDVCVTFYSDLYGQTDIDKRAWAILDKHIPLLNEGRGIFETEFTVQEFTEAMKALRLRKSPGSDGLPPEFYRAFWKELAEPLTKVFNFCLREGRLPQSFRSGLIKLLCKDESRKREVGAWRPVTLLNTDYKILAKAMQLKLGQAMDVLLSPMQASAVKGRSAQTHLSALRDMLAYYQKIQGRLLLVSFDQEKAFDRVNHEYLFHVLQRIGLPQLFISYVGLLYTEISSAVEINGKPSRSFAVRSGVRQGCPMSPLLYALTLEPLVRLLASSEAIPRAPIPGSSGQATLFAYADDMTLCTTTPGAVGAALRLMDIYGAGSGAKLNKSKSAVLRVNHTGPESQIAGIPVVDQLKVLGIVFTTGGVAQKTWTNIQKKLDSIREQHQNSPLGYRGKRDLIRTEMCSVIWYAGACNFPSRIVEKKLTQATMAVLWQGRPERIKRAVVQGPPECGGLNIFNIRLMCVALAIAQTCRVLEEDDHVAKPLALYSMGTLCTLFGERVNHRMPKAESPAPFYVELAKYVRLLGGVLLGSEIRHTTTKKLYESLFYVCKRDEVNTHIASTRGLLLSSFVDDARADLAWEMSHNVLPVATRLFRFRFRPTNECAMCGEKENHKHIFYDCVLASAMWRKMAHLFALPGIEYGTVQVFDPVPVGGGQMPSFCLLLNEIKFQLWASRNRKMYGGTNESLRVVTFYVRIALYRKLQLEYELLGVESFKRRWKNYQKLMFLQQRKVFIKF